MQVTLKASIEFSVYTNSCEKQRLYWKPAETSYAFPKSIFALPKDN